MIKEVSVEIIKKCPNLCIYCSSSSDATANETILFADLSSLIGKLSGMGVRRICLSGGEPFLHPELLRIVHYISSFGLEVNIYSCGVMLIEDESRPISFETLHELFKHGLNRIIFNLQSASEDKYDRITNTNGHYGIVLQSIRNAVKANILAEIHFVPMKINKNDIKEIIAFSEREGIEQVNFLKLMPHGRARDNIKNILLSYEDDVEVQRELLALRSESVKIRIGVPYSKHDGSSQCHAVKEKLYIRYDGCVFGCEAFKYIKFRGENKLISPENISGKPIDEILEASGHLNRSKELINKYSSLQVGCENCPVQKYLRVEEGIK